MKASILAVSLVRSTLTGISVFNSIGPDSMTMDGLQHTSVPWECLPEATIMFRLFAGGGRLALRQLLDEFLDVALE
jgi:hypothetical protein